MGNEITTPRAVRADKARDEIFKGAMKLMKKHGYQYVTVRNICTACNISTGTFYHYFSGKDDLLSYYLAEGFDNYLSKKPADALNGFPLNKKIVTLDKWYIEYCKQPGIEFLSSYYNPQNKSLHTRGSKTGKSYSALNTRVLAAVEEAIHTGELSKECSAKDICDDVCVILKGCIFDWCISYGAYELEEYVEKMINIYLSHYGI